MGLPRKFAHVLYWAIRLNNIQDKNTMKGHRLTTKLAGYSLSLFTYSWEGKKCMADKNIY